MPGKYSSLRTQLPRFEQPPDYQQQVDGVKLNYRAVAVQGLQDYANILMHRKAEKARLEEKIKEQNLCIEAVSQLLLEGFEEAGMSKAQYPEVGTVYLQDEPYTSTEDKERLLGWVRDQHPEMLTVQWQTLNAWAKECLVQGQDLPPGVKVYLKTSVKLRKE